MVATAYFIANGREHSFLIRILELFVISSLLYTGKVIVFEVLGKSLISLK